ELDLNKAEVSDFRRELNMKEGWLGRSFTATLQNGVKIAVECLRFLSLSTADLGAIRYQIRLLNQSANLVFKRYVDSAVSNQDANWEETFWEPLASRQTNNFGCV